ETRVAKLIIVQSYVWSVFMELISEPNPLTKVTSEGTQFAEPDLAETNTLKLIPQAR
ncbi:hypothetical protein Tco_1137949, partial [Tanacetum coccineum]